MLLVWGLSEISQPSKDQSIEYSRRRDLELDRRTAVAFGVCLIAAIICGIFSSVPTIEEADYLGKLHSIETNILVAVFFQAGMAILYTFIAVLTYPIVKKDSQVGGAAYLAFRITGAAFLFVGIVFLLLFLHLGREVSLAGAENVAPYQLIGDFLRKARDGLNHIGMILPWSIGGIFLYRAFLRAGSIPRWIAIGSLSSVSLTMIATLLYMLDQIQIVTVSYIALNIPTAVFELILAVYLLARGGRASPSKA